MIVANDVSDRDIGFNSEDNEVVVLWQGGEQAIERTGKAVLARQLIDLIAHQLKSSN
jgi:phosphopantothenoylcysteine decarboxylase/phosphopantothenate--cysteine ligase